MTELHDAPASFMLLGNTNYVVCAIRPVSAQIRKQHGSLIPLRAWTNRVVSLWLPPFTSLRAVAVAFGVAANRAVRLPDGRWRRFRPPVFVIDALPRLPAELAAAVPKPASQRELAIAVVDEVKENYGKLLSDIAYRVENAALFDSSVPTTARFEEALMLWDGLTSTVPEEELVRRSGMVKLTFATACAHAETIGLDHLPQQAREQARRAAKAARLARTSSSAHERQVALDQMIRILNSLALHYLPNPADARRQLEQAQGG